MEITEALDKIINAKKGKDVRQALHDGLQQCYDDATGNPESVAAVVAAVAALEAGTADTDERVDDLEAEVIDSITAEEIDAVFNA